MVSTALVVLGVVSLCRLLFLHRFMGAVIVTAIENLGSEVVLFLCVSVDASGSLVDDGVLGVGKLV